MENGYKIMTLESLFLRSRRENRGIFAVTKDGLRVLIYPTGEYQILSGRL